MSWTFSQALVAEYSAHISADTAPSAPLKLTPTVEPSSVRARMTARSRLSLFGTTCVPLTGDRGAELLTWYRAAFHAKTSQWRAKAQGSTAQSLDSGARWRGSFARWNRATSSWRTPQGSLFADLEPCSLIWPRWGSMHDGACWAQTKRALPTNANAFGFLLPTLTVNGNHNRKGLSEASGDGLSTALKKLPTLKASDATRGDCPSEQARESSALVSVAGGPLNPTWCEWFMGWPLGWTELKPLGTGKFQRWLGSHGR